MQTNQAGSVVVVIALILTLLLGVMAFTMDTGNIYLKRDQYQNAVEAAAMAGAIDLCGSDPVTTVRNIAKANGIENAYDTTVLEVSPGYYDENNIYSDFSTYEDFEADPDPETPENESVLKLDGSCCQYNNAMLVVLKQEEDSLTGALSGVGATVNIKAAAVAYLRRYGLVALGDNGIAYDGKWNSGYPVITDQVIHSNGSIVFNSEATFTSETTVTAVGAISGGSGTSNADSLDLHPIDWSELQEEAQANGVVYYPEEWPEGSNTATDWQTDSAGNRYMKIGTTYLFWPAIGDHDGAVYFFGTGDGQTVSATLKVTADYLQDGEEPYYGFTLAAQMAITMGSAIKATATKTLGGKGEDTAFIFSQGEILFKDRYSSLATGSANYLLDGVVFRSENKMTFQTDMRRISDVDLAHHYVRIIADSIIYENKVNSGIGAALTMDGLFGPPCPPQIVKLGRLVPVE